MSGDRKYEEEDMRLNEDLTRAKEQLKKEKEERRVEKEELKREKEERQKEKLRAGARSGSKAEKRRGGRGSEEGSFMTNPPQIEAH